VQSLSSFYWSDGHSRIHSPPRRLTHMMVDSEKDYVGLNSFHVGGSYVIHHVGVLNVGPFVLNLHSSHLTYSLQRDRTGRNVPIDTLQSSKTPISPSIAGVICDGSYVFATMLGTPSSSSPSNSFYSHRGRSPISFPYMCMLRGQQRPPHMKSVHVRLAASHVVNGNDTDLRLCTFGGSFR